MNLGLRAAATAICAWAVVGVVGLPGSATGQDVRPATDELLGLSRYLPDDADGYISFVQLGRLRQAVADSRAWQRIVAEPEAAALVEQLQALLKSNDLPPEARTALELLAAAGESEVTLATSPEVSRELLNLGRLGLLSVAVFAPSRFPPDSPPGLALEAKRAPLRDEWAATVSTIRVPSLVIAARVRDTAKFEPFVRAMLDQGRQALLAEASRGMPPEMQAVVAGAFSETAIGKSTLQRFHLRVGDVVPPPLIENALRQLPLDDAQRAAVAEHAANLTINVHVGFIGEYLTLAVSSDDKFLRAIVDRYEGRSAATLAAADKFAPIRAELTPDSAGILFLDAAESQREVRETLLPLLDVLTQPDTLALLGAPPQATATIRRLRVNLELAVSASPIRQQSVLNMDRGLRQLVRSEYDRDSVAAPTTPLVTPAMVPATAIGYSARREVSLEGLWVQARFLVEQTREQLKLIAAQYAGNPGAMEFVRGQEAQLDAVMKPLEKLSTSLQGETVVVAGGFAAFAVKDNPTAPIADLPIPTAAAIMRSPAPDLAVAGLRELFEAVAPLIDRRYVDEAERIITLSTKTVDGNPVLVLGLRGMTVEGFEPHVARVGDALVVSSSFALTKQIRDVAAGGAAIVGTAGHQAVQNLLPPTAHQLSYLDGAALARNLRATADGLFALVEKNREALQISEKDQAAIAQARRFIDIGLNTVQCFRGVVGSLMAEGRIDVLREWIRIDDLEP